MPYTCAMPSHAAANTYYTLIYIVNCCFTSTLDLLCPSPSPNLPLPWIVTHMHTCTGDNDIYVTHWHSYPPPAHSYNPPSPSHTPKHNTPLLVPWPASLCSKSEKRRGSHFPQWAERWSEPPGSPGCWPRRTHLHMNPCPISAQVNASRVPDYEKIAAHTHWNTSGKKLAATRIWTPAARSLLQTGFEHQWQEVCCNLSVSHS